MRYARDLIAWFEQLADQMESGEIDVERETDTDGSTLETLEDQAEIASRPVARRRRQ